MGEPIGMSSGEASVQMSTGKGEGQTAIRAPGSDVPSLEAKITETKARIEELRATRETLDEERIELTSKKETLQDEVARYVKMQRERTKMSSRTAPVKPRSSCTARPPSERTTSILSALFLLHSIATSDTSQ